MIHQQYVIMIHPELEGRKEGFQLCILRIKPGWSYSDINSKINQKAIFQTSIIGIQVSDFINFK